MVRICSYKDCYNTYALGGQRIESAKSFFKFPKNRRKIWMKHSGIRAEQEPFFKKTSKICEDHFYPHDINVQARGILNKFLNKTAIPKSTKDICDCTENYCDQLCASLIISDMGQTEGIQMMQHKFKITSTSSTLSKPTAEVLQSESVTKDPESNQTINELNKINVPLCLNTIRYDINSAVKCGEIYESQDEIYIVCMFCKKKFEEMPTFTVHRKIGYCCPVESVFNPISYKLADKCENKNLIESNKINETDNFINLENQLNINEQLMSDIILQDNTIDNMNSIDNHSNGPNDSVPNSFKDTLQLNCEVCDDILHSASDFEAHTFNHFKEIIFECQSCYEPITCYNEYVKHQCQNSGNKLFVFTCITCNIKLSVFEEINKHLNSHRKSYKCNKCNEELDTKKKIKEHRNSCKNRSADDSKRFQCDICGKFSGCKSNLDRHHKIHLGLKPNQCDDCLRIFENEEQLAEHRTTHKVEKKFHCFICNKSYRHDSTLNRHRLQAHSDEIPHECHICFQGFKIRSYLKRHMLIHSNERRFKCNLCPKSFKTPDYLQKHKRHSHMNKTKLSTFTES